MLTQCLTHGGRTERVRAERWNKHLDYRGQLSLMEGSMWSHMDLAYTPAWLLNSCGTLSKSVNLSEP